MWNAFFQMPMLLGLSGVEDLLFDFAEIKQIWALPGNE